MLLLTSYWTPQINYLIIQCTCKNQIHHPCNKWTIRCKCGKTENINKIRGQTGLDLMFYQLLNPTGGTP